ncbi:unnamed protein product [Calypogeia fissa]
MCHDRRHTHTQQFPLIKNLDASHYLEAELDRGSVGIAERTVQPSVYSLSQRRNEREECILQDEDLYKVCSIDERAARRKQEMGRKLAGREAMKPNPTPCSAPATTYRL